MKKGSPLLRKQARHLFEQLVSFRRETLTFRAQLLRPGYHDDYELELAQSSADTIARLTGQAGELVVLVVPLAKISKINISGVAKFLRTLSESPAGIFGHSAANLDHHLLVCSESIAQIFLIDEGTLLPLEKEAEIGSDVSPTP